MNGSWPTFSFKVLSHHWKREKDSKSLMTLNYKELKKKEKRWLCRCSAVRSTTLAPPPQPLRRLPKDLIKYTLHVLRLARRFKCRIPIRQATMLIILTCFAVEKGERQVLYILRRSSPESTEKLNCMTSWRTGHEEKALFLAWPFWFYNVQQRVQKTALVKVDASLIASRNGKKSISVSARDVNLISTLLQ